MLINREKAIAAVGPIIARINAINGNAGVYARAIPEALRALPVSDGATDEMVRTAAVAMWREESVRAAPNVAKQRTAEAFAQESEPTIARWTGLARAALEAALGPLPAPPTIE